VPARRYEEARAELERLAAKAKAEQAQLAVTEYSDVAADVAMDVAVARCSACGGLRTISHRNRSTEALCLDCRRGDVVSVAAFWLERFSLAEIRAMGRRSGARGPWARSGIRYGFSVGCRRFLTL